GGARRDRIDGAAEGLGAAGAEILHPRHRNEGQPQRGRERHRRLADVLFFDGGCEPGRIDLPGFNTGILYPFGEGFDHQVGGVAFPALAEFRAAHAEDGNLVTNSGGHHDLPSSIGAAFQKYRRKPRCLSTSLTRNIMRMRIPTASLSASTSVKSIIQRPPSSNWTMP